MRTYYPEHLFIGRLKNFINKEKESTQYDFYIRPRLLWEYAGIIYSKQDRQIIRTSDYVTCPFLFSVLEYFKYLMVKFVWLVIVCCRKDAV